MGNSLDLQLLQMPDAAKREMLALSGVGTPRHSLYRNTLLNVFRHWYLRPDILDPDVAQHASLALDAEPVVPRNVQATFAWLDGLSERQVRQLHAAAHRARPEQFPRPTRASGRWYMPQNREEDLQWYNHLSHPMPFRGGPLLVVWLQTDRTTLFHGTSIVRNRSMYHYNPDEVLARSNFFGSMMYSTQYAEVAGFLYEFGFRDPARPMPLFCLDEASNIHELARRVAEMEAAHHPVWARFRQHVNASIAAPEERCNDAGWVRDRLGEMFLRRGLPGHDAGADDAHRRTLRQNPERYDYEFHIFHHLLAPMITRAVLPPAAGYVQRPTRNDGGEVFLAKPREWLELVRHSRVAPHDPDAIYPLERHVRSR